MPQETQQYTPTQILEAGQQAEADGRIPHALRFYDHLADNYGWAPEAVAARSALARLREPASEDPPDIPELNGVTLPPSLPSARAGANGVGLARRALHLAPADIAVRAPLALPRPDVSYRIGGLIAGLILLAGAASLVAGAVFLLTPAWQLRLAQVLSLAQSLDGPTASVGLVAGGVVLLLAGELFRAIFGQARAARELVAIARARAEHDAAEVDRVRVDD